MHDTDAARQTPAQPRFLLSKRSGQSQQKGKQAATPGPHQFASTPRFSLATPTTARAAARQQPPPFSTPAPPGTTARAHRAVEPLSDAIDDTESSPVSDGFVAPGEGRGDRDFHPLNESLEIEESPASPREALSQGQEDDDERPLKRRRMSFSSDGEDGSCGDYDGACEPMEMDDGYEPMEINDTPLADEDDANTVPTQSSADSEDQHHTSVAEEQDGDGEDNRSSSPLITEQPRPPHTTRHPTFRSAPRFKAAARPPLNDTTTDDHNAFAAIRGPLLPEAFSPQRRGAKAFVSGGLAAEVRDWLVQVKGASEYDQHTGGEDGSSGVRVVVDEARGPVGGGMWVVQTRGEEGSLERKKVILAGDGRLLGGGLAGRSVISEGAGLKLFQPMWDVTLRDLGQFAVACDWEVDV